MACSQSNGTGRDDVANDHPCLLDDDAVDHKLEHPLLDLKGRVDESVPNAAAEALQPLQQTEFAFTVLSLPIDLRDPLPQEPAMVGDPTPPLLEFVKGDCTRLVGINQPLRLAVQGRQLAANPLPLPFVLAVDRRIAPAL